jgi:transposase
MLTKENTMEIKILSKQGLSLRSISKETGYALNTIRKYLSGGEPVYKERQIKKPTKLSAYESYIRERLSAVSPEWIPATVMYRELLSKGYTGKIRQLRYFMASLKPKSVAEPVIRFETEPGQQIQIDWAHVNYQGAKLYAFVALLGYSRLAFVRFMDNMQIDSLLQCHEALFETLGGVPKQCLYDNMKTVVIQRNAYGTGQHRLHPHFNDFAKHYGFMPRLCKPYRAKTKGKVERFIRYLRASFLIPLVGCLRQARLVLDKDTANLEVAYWLDEVANNRLHATTGEIPKERFKIEQKVLQALPLYSYFPIQRANPSIHLNLAQWPAEPLQHPLSTYEQFCQEVQS